MLLSLIRTSLSPLETRGTLLIGNKPLCNTLEPPVVPNAQHPKGAVPLGWYRLTLTQSPHFGRVLPLLHYVPGFEGIRIHAGNNRDHTAGCILVGKLSGSTLLNSRRTEKEIVELLNKHKNEEHYIEISTPERFCTEHCGTNADIECLLCNRKRDRQQASAEF